MPLDRPEFATIEPGLARLKPSEVTAKASAKSDAPEGIADDASNIAMLLTEQEKNEIKSHFQSSSKQYSAFLSHHKDACGATARLIKGILDQQLGKKAFLGECHGRLSVENRR